MTLIPSSLPDLPLTDSDFLLLTILMMTMKPEECRPKTNGTLIQHSNSSSRNMNLRLKKRRASSRNTTPRRKRRNTIHTRFSS